MANTVEVLGKKFLKCQQQDCEWNIGWLGGYKWTRETGKGTRICNFGLKAIIEADAGPPDICQQPTAVLEMARAELEL
jgi:hypothetical protein